MLDTMFIRVSNSEGSDQIVYFSNLCLPIFFLPFNKVTCDHNFRFIVESA